MRAGSSGISGPNRSRIGVCGNSALLCGVLQLRNVFLPRAYVRGSMLSRRALERSGPSISGFGVVVGLRDEGGQ